MPLPSIHQFSEKVALVSDASSPIGRAVAIQLALNGAYVIGLFPTGGNSAANFERELVELGTIARSFEINGWTDDGARIAAEEVQKSFGRLDILVNCLKFVPESSFHDITESDLSDTFIRNIGPAVFLTRSMFELMRTRPRARIVNVAIAAGSTQSPVFEAAQEALKNLTVSLSRTLPDNFRVNGVEFMDHEAADVMKANSLAEAARVTPPDEVARAVMFLLSSESTAVNGNIIKLG